MSSDFRIMFRIYFVLFLIICKPGVVVVGDFEHSNECVGQSCQDTGGVHDRSRASMEMERELEMTDQIKKNLEVRMRANPSEHGADGKEPESQDKNGIYDVRELSRLRAIQQQKAVEESRRKFLSRRSVPTSSSDDELEELNRLVQDSYRSSDKLAKLHSGENEESIYNNGEIDDRADSHQNNRHLKKDSDVLMEDPKMDVSSSVIDDEYEEGDDGFEYDDSDEFEDEDDGTEIDNDNEFETFVDKSNTKTFDTRRLEDELVYEKQAVHVSNDPRLEKTRPDIQTEKTSSRIERDAKLREKDFASFDEHLKSKPHIETARSESLPSGIKEHNRADFDKSINREMFEPHDHHHIKETHKRADFDKSKNSETFEPHDHHHVKETHKRADFDKSKNTDTFEPHHHHDVKETHNRVDFEKSINREVFEPHDHPKNEGTHDEIESPPLSRAAGEGKSSRSGGLQVEEVYEPDETQNSFDRPSLGNIDRLNKFTNDGENFGKSETPPREHVPPPKRRGNSFLAGMIRKNSGFHNPDKDDSLKDLKVDSHATSHEQLRDLNENIGNSGRDTAPAYDDSMKLANRDVELFDNDANKMFLKDDRDSLNRHPHVRVSKEVPISESSASTETSKTNDKNNLVMTVETSSPSKGLPFSHDPEMRSEQPTNERLTPASTLEKMQQPSSVESFSIPDTEKPRMVQAAERLQDSQASEKLSVQTISEGPSESPNTNKHHTKPEGPNAASASDRPITSSYSGKSFDSARLDSEKNFPQPIYDKIPDSGSLPTAFIDNKPPTPIVSERLSVLPSADRPNVPHDSESLMPSALLKSQTLEKSNSLPAASTALPQSSGGSSRVHHKEVEDSSSTKPQIQQSSESLLVSSASGTPQVAHDSHTISLSDTHARPDPEKSEETFNSERLSKASYDTSHLSDDQNFTQTESVSNSSSDYNGDEELSEGDHNLKQEFDKFARPDGLDRNNGKFETEFERIQHEEIDYDGTKKKWLKEGEERRIDAKQELNNANVNNEVKTLKNEAMESYESKMHYEDMKDSGKEMPIEIEEEDIGKGEDAEVDEDTEEIEMPLDVEGDLWDEDSYADTKDSVIKENDKFYDQKRKQNHSHDEEIETRKDLEIQRTQDMKTENGAQITESYKVIDASREIVEQAAQTLEEIKLQGLPQGEYSSEPETLETDDARELTSDVKAEQFSKKQESERKSESDQDQLDRTKTELVSKVDDGGWNEPDEIVSVSSEIVKKSASSEDGLSGTKPESMKPGTDSVNIEQRDDGAKLSSSDETSSEYDKTAYFTDDSSFFTRLLGIWDHWSIAIFNWLPSTVQSLISYFTLSLNPSKALTICIISSATFFFISVIVYYRKSNKSDTKARGSSVGQKKPDGLHQKERDDLQKEIKSLRVQLMDLQSKCQTSNAEKKDSVSQLNMIKTERDALKLNAVQLESKIQQLQTLIETKDQTLLTEREQSYAYQQANQQLSTHIAYLELQVSQLTNHWSAAQKSSVASQSQIQCMTEELSVMQTEKDRIYMELEDFKEKVQKLMQTMKKMHQNEAKYLEDIARKEQEIQAMKNFVTQITEVADNSQDNAGTFVSEDLERLDKKALFVAKESVQEMLKNVVEMSEMHAKMKDLEAERDLLKSLVSSDMENRSKLEEETKHLKDLMKEEIKKREDAEKRAKDSAVRIEVLSGYFQAKESETKCGRGSADGSIGHSDGSGLQNFVNEGKMKDLELSLKEYKEKTENLKKEMLKADAEHRKQLAAQEKKTHENWLLARQNEREANDFRNEASTLKLKVMQLQTRLDDLQSNKPNADLSAVLPDVALVMPPPIPMLPSVPPPVDEIFPSERLKFYGPPLLPFPPPPFDIPPPHNIPLFDHRIHRRSLPFNAKQVMRQERSSPGDRHHRHRSPSPTAGDSSFSSGSLKVSPMPTGKDSPHAGIQSPPKIIDMPGPEGRRPVAVRPHHSQRINRGNYQ